MENLDDWAKTQAVAEKYASREAYTSNNNKLRSRPRHQLLEPNYEKYTKYKMDKIRLDVK